MIAAVNDNSRAIRHNLAQRVRYQLRKTPELTFFLDDSLDYIDNIDNILNKDKEEHPWHDPKDWEGLDEIYKDLK